MKKTQTIEVLYKDAKLKEASRNIAPNKKIAEDLFQEVFLRLLEMPDEDFAKILNPRYYIIKMMFNWCRGRSEFFNNYIKIHPQVNIESVAQNAIEPTEMEIELSGNYFNAVTPLTVSIVKELSKIEKEQKAIGRYPYKKDIFIWYTKLGSSRNVERETGINYGTVHKIINEIKKRVNENSSSTER